VDAAAGRYRARRNWEPCNAPTIVCASAGRVRPALGAHRAEMLTTGRPPAGTGAAAAASGLQANFKETQLQDLLEGLLKPH